MHIARTVLTLLFSLVAVFSSFQTAHAIEDPLAKPNNKFGIHILFSSELAEAEALVNSNGGEWGYVVIPIQAGDRDIDKWQAFMDECRKKKIIPIIRLATENYYFDTKVWRKPKEEDVLDFANFLNSLTWPVKNRYIIVFNEVNRDDEWGGQANPAEYASILQYASTVFKSLSDDFYIIASGMDNASINGNGAINQFDYFRRMNRAVPGVFNHIDAISSHSYPNPGFSGAPTATHQMSIASFRFERTLIESMSNKELPIFITETGWSSDTITDDVRASYYEHAFSNAWTDPGIVTVAPFLLRAGGGPFQQFSFIKDDGSKTKQYEAFTSLKKVKGEPEVVDLVLGSESQETEKLLPIREFEKETTVKLVSRTEAAMSAFNFIFGI